MSSKMELLGSSVLQGQDSVKKVLWTKDTDKGCHFSDSLSLTQHYNSHSLIFDAV